MKKNRINGLNHLMEFATVVIGILLAFQLNTCSNKKQHNATIETHLNQILEETSYNKNNVEASIALTWTNLNKIDTLFGLIMSRKDLPLTNKLTLDILNLGGLYLRKNAYSSLVESGDIRFMSNFDDKKRIINLYEYYKWIEGLDKITIENYNKDYLPYIKSNFDLLKGKMIDEQDFYNPEFSNILIMHQFMLNNKVQKYEQCLVEMNKYIGNSD